MRGRTKVVLLPLLLSVLQLSAAKTVSVSQAVGTASTTFYQAVLDPTVSDILLTANYTLGDDFSQYKTAPHQLTRNVTVTGLHGTADVLDLQFKLSKIQLCETCVWTWRNLTIANERRGGGAAWDIFVGPAAGAAYPMDGHALVIAENVVRWRWACPAAKYTKDIIRTNQRPTNLPKAAGHEQNFTITMVTYMGHQYPDTLRLHDHGAVVPRTVQEGRGVTGGYAVWDHNVTRLCAYIVGEDCLAVRSPEACVNDRIDKALADQAAAASKGSGRRRLDPGQLAAAVAVPIVVAAVLVTVLSVTWRRRGLRRRQLQQSMHGNSQGPYDSKDGDSSRWLHAENGQGSGNQSDYQGLMGARRGWELTSTHTNPRIGHVDDGRIMFGDLLGAGSFGRVYKGTWGGRTVAVKVIEYDTSSRAEVENEVQLMLSFNHPNIVHAYHAVTYTCTGTTTGSGTKVSDRTVNGANKGAAAAGNARARRSSADSSSSVQQPQQHINTDLYNKAKRLLSRGLSPAAGAPDKAVSNQRAVGAAMQSTKAPGESQDGGDVDLQGERDRETWTVGQPGGAQTDKDQQCWTISERKGADGGHTLGVVVGPSRVETWLVQEYCNCGTLGNTANRLRETRSSDSLLRLIRLLSDVASGLKVLHIRNTVHGDLNARNVLVSTTVASPDGYTAKLADLGLARVMLKHRTHRTTDTVGTMSHMPPELLRFGKQSPAGDIYAFGIMMWELYTGAQAFKDLHYGQFFEEIVLNVVRPPLPAGMPADYLLLMDHCWAADPADRPTVDRLMQCIEFMIQERQKSANSNRISTAIMPTMPPVHGGRSTATSTSTVGTGSSSFTPTGASFVDVGTTELQQSRHIGTLSETLSDTEQPAGH